MGRPYLHVIGVVFVALHDGAEAVFPRAEVPWKQKRYIEKKRREQRARRAMERKDEMSLIVLAVPTAFARRA